MAESLVALFLALAGGDLVAGGLAGTPLSVRRARAGAVVACGVWYLLERAWTPGALDAASVLTTFPPLVLWYLTRNGSTSPGAAASRRAVVSLGCFALLFVPLFVPAFRGDTIATAASPGGSARRELLLLLSIAVFQGPTANALVRQVLQLAEISFERQAQRLRGGRFIGLFERWLIVGLAPASLTAAALVVSAKSLLRFPELSSIARAGAEGPANIAEMTEYFLLGSLVSWTIALASAALLRLPG